jgi:hypothetical protein
MAVDSSSVPLRFASRSLIGQPACQTQWRSAFVGKRWGYSKIGDAQRLAAGGSVGASGTESDSCRSPRQVIGPKLGRASPDWLLAAPGFLERVD